MNDNNEQKDFQKVIDMLESARGIRPSEASFKAFLNAIPEHEEEKRPVKSPWLVSFGSVHKFAAAALAVLVIASGVFVSNRILERNAAKSVSDASIQQDLNSLDAEMVGLDSDNANIDQVINQ